MPDASETTGGKNAAPVRVVAHAWDTHPLPADSPYRERGAAWWRAVEDKRGRQWRQISADQQEWIDV